MILHRELAISLLTLEAIGAAHATEVSICTDRGRAVLELNDEQSPLQVANFLRYVDMAFYSGTVFHRVVPDFVVQGGGVDRKLRSRSTLPPVVNESSNGLRNARGTVAAARTQNPDSAAAQFFVNLVDNEQLDAGREPGYTVFGRVTDGMEVFDEIGRLPTAAAGPFQGDVPTPLVVIHSIARLDETALAELPPDGREAALKQRIEAAAATDDFAEALRLIGLYRSICGAEIPDIALLEAQAALARNETSHAAHVLEEYFATTASSDPSYAAAAELYREAVPSNDAVPAQPIDDCVPPPAPEIPDGTTATAEEMVAGQGRAREFVATGETYLRCLSKFIDDKKRAVEDRNAAIAEHNRMVASMEQVAAAFNEQIRNFKARSAAQ